MLAFTNAHIVSGSDLVLDLANFGTALNNASLVITGEGHIDTQTMKGKLPYVVASRAAALGIPVLAVCGKCDLDITNERLPFKVLETCPKGMALTIAMQKQQAKDNISKAVTAYMTGTLGNND